MQLLLILSLGVSLAMASAQAGYARTAHALARAGMQTMTICGAGSETETITLDRHGEPVDAPPGHCTHCADCTLVPASALPGGATAPTPDSLRRAHHDALPALPDVRHVVRSKSRGPPVWKVIQK